MMLYINEWERLRRRLTNEQMGRLIGSVLDALAGRDGESLDDDPALALAFELVSAQIERDGERYDALIEKRREAGRKSGAKRRQNAEQLAAGANKCEQTPAKRTNTNSNTNTNSLSPQPSRGNKREKAVFPVWEREGQRRTGMNACQQVQTPMSKARRHRMTLCNPLTGEHCEKDGSVFRLKNGGGERRCGTNEN